MLAVLLLSALDVPMAFTPSSRILSTVGYLSCVSRAYAAAYLSSAPLEHVVCSFRKGPSI